MQNEILKEYERLNSRGRHYVDVAIKAAASLPTNLKETSQEELQEIKHQQEEAERTRKIEEEKHSLYFEELKAECDTMSHEDYMAKLNEVFQELPTYKLRYFFLFISAKLNYSM